MEVSVIRYMWACLCIAVLAGHADGASLVTVKAANTDMFLTYDFTLDITNRIYNVSLLTPQSQDYKVMYEEVSSALYSVYGCSTCDTHTLYQGVTSMTFSNELGSVLVKVALKFSSDQTNAVVLKNLFERALTNSSGINGLQFNPKIQVGIMSGRGRGRSLFTFNVDSLGFGRGEALPSGAQAPTALYPPMQFRPVPLQTGEEVEYMLALKQELRASSRNLPFHIQPSAPRKDVARYSDKYQTGQAKNSEWTPDWNRLPKELCPRVQKSRKSKTKPVLKSKTKPAAPKELLQKLENLEKKEEENQSEEEEDKEKKNAGEEEEEPDHVEEYDEEEFEEGTDYIMSYFDNGEGFGGDSDDNADEATY
ncbi:polymerase (RNA) III (DNA directed) polypeptide G like a isoform 2 [Silurus meridionalis]|nr:polymerase (RNA) III (DNA directed) polypeptide G like a isoform 2 [Silurus meridionalis]